MKKIIAAAAISTFVASSAFAGGMDSAEMEDAPMVEMPAENGGSAKGFIVPLAALVLLAAVAN